MTEHEHHHRIPGLLAVALVSALVAVIFGFGAGFLAGDAQSGGSMLKTVAPPVYAMLGYEDRAAVAGQESDDRMRALIAAAKSEEIRRIAVVRTAVPAVVSIIAEKDVPKLERLDSDPFANDLFSQFFGDVPGMSVPGYQENGTEHQEIGVGTGFFATEDGLIVTNKHVIADEEAEYTVVTNDGERHSATVLGRDPSNDLAILKIEGGGYPYLELSDASPVVGQGVIAVGYALGQFSNSVSVGIVSGLSRSIRASDSLGLTMEDLHDVIQTDAAINPGNSGGPLLDIDGRAIGVNVAVVQGSENIGFALPSQDVRRVVESVQRTGHIARPFIGVRYVIIDKDLAKKNSLPYDYGALVVRGDLRTDLAVIPGSPADIAGIIENDIILEVEGQRVTTEQPLSVLIRNYDVGSTVTVRISRKGEEIEEKLDLAERE